MDHILVRETHREELAWHIRALLVEYRADVFDRTTLSTETTEAIERLIDTVTP